VALQKPSRRRSIQEVASLPEFGSGGILRFSIRDFTTD
jgi:hypothetical protein